jgi:hypothetical protein
MSADQAKFEKLLRPMSLGLQVLRIALENVNMSLQVPFHARRLNKMPERDTE